MTARRILKWPSPALKAVAEPIENFDEDLRQLSVDLYHTMITSFCAGIAATQIGVKKSICVISSDYVPSLPVEKSLTEGSCVVLVNPSIQVNDAESFVWEEACLSVPEIKARVSRKKSITISYQNLDGDVIKETVSDTESATLQHEVDHLFGRLFITRLTGYTKTQVMKKLRQSLRNNLPSLSSTSPTGRRKKVRPKKKKSFGKKKKK